MNHSAVVYRSPHALRLVQQWLFVLLAIICLVVPGPVLAKRTNGGLAGGIVPTPVLTPPAAPPQFDITGFIEDATVAPVGSMCTSVTEPRLMGGTVTLNGQKITVPCNTILQMPAYALTWADLFTLAPKDITPAGTSGLGLADPFVPGTAGLLNSTPTGFNSPLPSHEIHVVGNVINGEYIAGLIFISQQSLNSGQGVISCIDYATGEMQVGGTVQATGTPCTLPAAPGVTRVRMNDPVGRYGIVHGGPGTVGADVIEPGYDPRFTADTDNPTMHSTLGYPVCIPTINPVNPITDPITGAQIAAGVDPLCPVYNRPIVPNCRNFDPLTTLPAFGGQAAGYCMTWVMDAPGAHAIDPTATDPTAAAPLMPGDTIIFSGTTKADASGPYISAHTIAANLGIYTQPHTKPAYVFMEGVLVGTGGGTVAGLAVESTSKVSWVGFTTDPTELVDFYSVHQDPVTGDTTEFYLGTQDPCCTPLGRFRTVANNVGAFGEPQRNYRAVSRTMCQPDPLTPGTANPANTPKLQTLCHMDPLYAPDLTAKQAPKTPQQDGLIPGQYTLPNFEFIFAENLNFGAPLVPNNFQDLPFLFCGSGPINGPGTASAVVAQLDPAPWAPPMADPVFHASLCPQVKAVDGTIGITPVTTAPLPPVINSVTATPASTIVGTTTTVTLSASATNPNGGTAMSYAWSFPAGVVMSCGVCLPNANNATVTATFTPQTGGPMTFTVKVSNGVLPDATGSAVVNVAALNSKPPVLRSFNSSLGSVNAGQLVTLTAIGNTNPTGGTVSFTFKQTGGTPVTLSPITLTGTAPNDQTGRATFIAPVSLTKVNLTFQATVKDNTTGLTTTGSATQVSVTLNPVPSDVVTITAVNYRSTQTLGGQLTNVGKLTITALSSATTANPPPVGMTMTAFYSNSSLPANVSGSTALPLSMQLTLQAADLPGTLVPVCGATPCWTGSVVGVIADTSVTPAVLVPPTSVTVKSSLLGTATMTQGDPLFVVN